jgi:hypothetical protein
MLKILQKPCQNLKAFFRNPLMNKSKSGIAAGENICSLTVPGLVKWCSQLVKCEQDRMIIHRFVSRYSAKISDKIFLTSKAAGFFAGRGIWAGSSYPLFLWITLCIRVRKSAISEKYAACA